MSVIAVFPQKTVDLMFVGFDSLLVVSFVIGKAQFSEWLPVIAKDFSETIRIYRYL